MSIRMLLQYIKLEIMRAWIEVRVMGTEKGMRTRVIMEVKLSDSGNWKLKQKNCRMTDMYKWCLEGWWCHQPTERASERNTVRATLSLAIWKYPGGAENGGVLNSGESSGLRISRMRWSAQRSQTHVPVAQMQLWSGCDCPLRASKDRTWAWLRTTRGRAPARPCSPCCPQHLTQALM